ncbi:hypothetical protein [Piscinibacter koreensis]|uniref:Uncharacterized protein n=1 Tax=Piscinibacter koreensis TaxID=2742824 RepID=A0A7Y6TV30_9BURK|nr:hypothetical protein [Schlegelella koreensis]NUZ04506.1 hypothetical protein [Schlegelella koreensis]
MVTRTIGPPDTSQPPATADPAPRRSSGALEGVLPGAGLPLIVTGHPRTPTLPHAAPSHHDVVQMHRRKRELLQEIFDRFERRHRNDARAPEIAVRRRILEEIDQRWQRIAAEGSTADALAFVQALLGAFNRRGARLRAAAPDTDAARPVAPPASSGADGARRASDDAARPDGAGDTPAATAAEPRFAYANMFEVVFHGRARARGPHERLSVSYAYMDPLLDLASRARRPGADDKVPRLAREWLDGDGWTQTHGPAPVAAADARELAMALAAVARSDFDASFPADYVDDCLRCAAAIGEFIARQLAAGRDLQIQNV